VVGLPERARGQLADERGWEEKSLRDSRHRGDRGGGQDGGGTLAGWRVGRGTPEPPHDRGATGPLDRLARVVPDRGLLNLVGQYLRRCAERGGLYWQYERGLSLGCPLSPIMGAFFLHELDERLGATGLFYVRFMDDVVVLAPTRWQVRRAIAVLNRTFALLGLEKQRAKTFIGRVERGFDFLGYRVSPSGLTVAEETLRRFVARVTRLYEQGRGRPGGSAPLGSYVRRWVRWTGAGVPPSRSGFLSV